MGEVKPVNKLDIAYGEAGPTYGLELVLLVHSPVIKTRSDVLCVWLHWCFLRNGFQSHGGEFTHVDVSSENLPRNLGWNGDKKAYILKYVVDTQPYAVGIFIKDDDNEVVEISVITLHKSMRLGISVSDLVDKDDFQISSTGSDNLAKVIDDELLRPLLPPRP